jgi:DNA-dependent RNA polymerase auxiliary subunit epsilon
MLEEWIVLISHITLNYEKETPALAVSTMNV